MFPELANETAPLVSALTSLVCCVMYALAWRADPEEVAPGFWALEFAAATLWYPLLWLGRLGVPGAEYAIDGTFVLVGMFRLCGCVPYAGWPIRLRHIVLGASLIWLALAAFRLAELPPAWSGALTRSLLTGVLLASAATFYRVWRRRHGGYELALAGLFAIWGAIRLLDLVAPADSHGIDLFAMGSALVLRLSTAALFMYLVQQRMVQRLRIEAIERRRAETVARQDERRFADLVELSSDWIWEMDAELRITYMSPKIRTITGMPPAFYIGKTRAEADAADSRDETWLRLEDAMLARQPFHGVLLRSPRRDTGQIIHYELSGKPIYDMEGRYLGYRGIGRDLSRLMGQMQERERAEAAARESERRFESLVELSSDWIWETDEFERFTYVSPRICDLSGTPAEFYIGKMRAEFHAVDTRESGWIQLEAKTQARESFRDLPMRAIHRETGKVLYYELSGRPLYDADGRFCGYRGIGRDVTQQTVSRSTVDAILGGVADIVGSDYFEALVSHLARALDMDVAVVATGNGSQLRTQAIWIDGNLADTAQIKIAGTPVEDIMAGESREYATGVARAFPTSRWLREQKIDGFVGTPLRDGAGRPIGVLLLQKRSPIHNLDVIRAVLTALAPRAAAELQRQFADEQSRSAERLFRSVIDNMPAGILVKVDDRYRVVNRTFASWLRMTSEELERMTDAELFSRMGWGGAQWTNRTADQHWVVSHAQPVIREEKLRLPDSRDHDVLVTSFPIPGPGGKVSAIGIVITDVTELRRAERDLQQTQKMDALGRLAGGVAHDFNNIVGAIQGFARFIVQDSPSGSKNREHAERIVNASARAKQLIQQVLTFSRRTEMRREDLSLQAAIADATGLLKATAPASTEIEVDSDMPAAIVEADAAQISQVLVNLGVNAIDALDGAPGRIVFSARRQRGADAATGLKQATPIAEQGEHLRVVAGTVDAATDYVVIRVQDTGTGMERDVMERIFEPFFTTKPVGKGTGLGLAVVHGIILNHRGAIAVTSRIGHGTTIDIWLPEAGRQAIEHRAVSDGAVVSNGARRILIVDDDVDFGDMLATTMERLGYEVAVATDPRDAIATIEEDAAAWDLVLTDQNMPGLPGLEVIARVKRRRPELPCILCTAYGQNVTEAVALQAGASAYVRKPVDIAALERTLRDLLGPS